MSYVRGGFHFVTSETIQSTRSLALPSLAFAASRAVLERSRTAIESHPAASRKSTRRDAPPPMSINADLGVAPISLMMSSEVSGRLSNQLTPSSPLLAYAASQ